MPNWCNNSICITGPKDKIKKLYDNHVVKNSSTGLLAGMVPPPKNMLLDNIGTAERQFCAEQGIPNWYDWRIINWGTKWEINSDGLELTDNGDGTAAIAGQFVSAWAPPIEAYNSFLRNNEDCSLISSYLELGYDFGGIYKNGDLYFMDDFQAEVMDVLTGYTTLDNTSEMFKEFNDVWNIIDNFSQWYELENINDAREFRGMEPLTKEEYLEMIKVFS